MRKDMKIGRTAYTVAGLALVGVGFVGIVLPGLPTTIFMILALFCFKKGSPRFEKWLLNHKVFGPTLRDWEKNRAIKRRTKTVAVTTMLVFSIASIFIIGIVWVKFLIGVLAAVGTWYVLSRKTVEDLPLHVQQSSETYRKQLA